MEKTSNLDHNQRQIFKIFPYQLQTTTHRYFRQLVLGWVIMLQLRLSYYAATNLYDSYVVLKIRFYCSELVGFIAKLRVLVDFTFNSLYYPYTLNFKLNINLLGSHS